MKIGGETIRVKVEGDVSRPVLVLSNSLGTDLSMWDTLMPALLERFRVVRYDTRGHGESAVPEGSLSIERLGRDVLGILDEIEIEKAHFLGISMGGAIGQWLIANAPARIERAVLACTATRFGQPDAWNARILAVKRDGMAAVAAATMERWFGPEFTMREPDAVDRVRKSFLACPPDGYVACCAALRDLDLHAAIEGTETPVLVLTGVHDPVIDGAATATLLAALPNARHIALEARHIAALEAHPAFVEAAIGFLTAKLPARRRAAPAAPSIAPRSRAARRVTAARLPLAKPSTIRKAKTAAAKARKPTAARPKARRPPPDAAKLAETRPTAAKKAPSAAKKAVAKAKTAKPTRRPAKVTAARGAVKSATARAKPVKTSAKPATKKTTKPAKRPPASRRKPAKTPRRPTGRRKT